MTSSSIYKKFSLLLLEWFDKHGRKDLPWQTPRSAYRVWVSEIMLQQTQVKTVIPYFNRFIATFPDVQALAKSHIDAVLALWSGLGYYSRARNLHKTSMMIMHDFGGEFPKDVDQWQQFPGIGKSTAAAITSQAFDLPTAILDGNVKRVLSRYFLIKGSLKQANVEQALWKLAGACMPEKRCRDYTQAIMDFGATCCTTKNPNCSICPLKPTCLAHRHNEVANYPNKTPKKILPHQYQQFLVMHTPDHSIYLEKRPPNGIWGGLWSLPTIDIHQSPAGYIEEKYQFKPLHIQEITTLKHTFSHFHLHIIALSIALTKESNRISNLPGQWFSIEEIARLGLAKPVRHILNQYAYLNATTHQ